LKILIAEDDSISRTVLTRTVEKLGHECLATSDGYEAWEAYKNNPDVEVIISDWMMPEMDGLDLCRRVRNLDRDGYTYFIFLTSLGGREHLLDGMEAGADEYLTKPLDGEQLEQKLAAASHVTSLHRHMKSENGTGVVRRETPEAGAPGHQKSKTGLPALRRGIASRAGGKAWDILIAEGKLTEEQIQQALEIQKGNPMELGKTLVSLGYISAVDLAKAQAQRLNLGYVELTESDVDRDVVELFPERLLRRHNALPIHRENGQLVVAMSNPTDIYALDDLRMVCGCPVVPVVATEENLHRMQSMVFSIGEQVAEILEEAADPEAEDQSEIQIGAEALTDEAPVVRLVNSVLQRAVGEGASDIHLEPQAKELKVRLRVDGVLKDFMSVPPKLQASVLARLKILANLNIAEHRIPQDGRFSVRLGGKKKVDLRVATLPTIFGEEIVLRLLDTSSLRADLTDLGFATHDFERYKEVYERPYGTVLVTGPTGSGKSTTLYATLGALNSPQRKIITIEDPVEYRMRGINQIQINPRVGLTFASGLRSILRSDPDVVMVGEIRDPETAKTSVEAALTGHLVLTTLHTNDAPSAVTRLTEMGVEPFLTATAVDCVIAQRLARRLCENCKRPVEVDAEVLSHLNFPFELLGDGEPQFYEAVGCERCSGSGYRGRIGLYELMVVTDNLKDFILRRASTAQISQVAEQEGMVRLREDGLLKAAQGITTIEEVLRTVV
jgi:type IV pilus assembly protein PilB